MMHTPVFQSGSCIPRQQADACCVHLPHREISEGVAANSAPKIDWRPRLANHTAQLAAEPPKTIRSSAHSISRPRTGMERRPRQQVDVGVADDQTRLHLLHLSPGS